MGETIVWIIALLVVAVGAWMLSARRTRSRVEGRSGAAAAGTTPDAEGGGAERARARSEPAVERTARDALTRMHGYLRGHVLEPLRKTVDRIPKTEKPRIREAMRAVEELEVLLEEQSRELRDVRVDSLLKEVVEQFSADSPMTVELHLPDSPVEGRLSPEAFQDAIFLVLLNTEDFAAPGTVRVRLRERRGTASIRIRDEGPGFTDESLQRALDPFFSTREGALGLGLAHAYRTISFHGGEIEVGNTEQGAEVEIRIPVKG